MLGSSRYMGSGITASGSGSWARDPGSQVMTFLLLVSTQDSEAVVAIPKCRNRPDCKKKLDRRTEVIPIQVIPNGVPEEEVFVRRRVL
ncbi:hypothetical protein ACROYT_G041412 [Oculina patagonica]